jgi:hypothetical protein
LSTLSDKLASSALEQEDYVFQYFGPSLDKLSDKMPWDLEVTLIDKLEAGDRRYYNLIKYYSWESSQDAWEPEVKKAFLAFQEKTEDGQTLDDDIPF